MLLPHLASETNDGFDHERDVVALQPCCEFLEGRRSQQNTEVWNRHLCSVDRVSARNAGPSVDDMGDELMAADVPVDPMIGFSPSRATEHLAVEVRGRVEISDRNRKVEAGSVVGVTGEVGRSHVGDCLIQQ